MSSPAYLQALKDLETSISGGASSSESDQLRGNLLTRIKEISRINENKEAHNEPPAESAEVADGPSSPQGVRSVHLAPKESVWADIMAFMADKNGKDEMVVWGVEHFDHFLGICEEGFRQPEHRIDIILLIITVLLKVPYEPGSPAVDTLMYRCADHSIFKSILRSLHFDTSNALFPLCLRLVLMCVPYAPALLCPHVPLLMIALGRAACWRDRPFVDTESPARDAVTRTPSPAIDQHWEVAKASLAPPATTAMNLQPEQIVRLWLVALYGAWPSNVLAFVRDPVQYLQGKNIPPIYSVDWPKVWPNQILPTRTKPLLSDFGLHPSLILFNSTAELLDLKRWEKNDPSAFISKSHMIAHSELTAGGMFGFLEDSPVVLAKEGEVVLREPVVLEMSSPKLLRAELEQQQSQTEEERLRKENDILHLEAQFGDRVRKQMLYHIGRLHRNSLRFNGEEAEIHSFVNRLKEQSKTIASLSAELSMQREEASAAKRKHQNWEAGLRKKNDTFREERKTWQSEATALRTELKEVQALVKRQKDELAIVKNERFKLQNQLTEVEPKIRHIEDYEVRMKQLTEAQRLWDGDIEKCNAAKAESEMWQGKCYQLAQLLRVCEQKRKEQAQVIENFEAMSLGSSNSAPTPPQTEQDKKLERIPTGITVYTTIAEEAKKRAEKAERENLQLHSEVARLTKLMEEGPRPNGDRDFIWGRSNSPSMFPV